MNQNYVRNTRDKSNRQDQVYFTLDRMTCSWIVDKETCRIQSTDPNALNKIRRWSFSNQFAWWLGEPTRAFTIPRKKWMWAMKQLGIQGPTKNLGRVCAGRQVGRQNLKKVHESPGQNAKLPLREAIVTRDKAVYLREAI